MATSKNFVEQRIEEAKQQLDAMIAAHGEYIEAERAHRIERRRTEHRVREASGVTSSAAAELLLEADPTYSMAFQRWKKAQADRKRTDGEYEIAKMGAWAAIRAVG